MDYLHTTIAYPQNTRKFTLAQVRRVPVTLSEEARRVIDRSTHQGRLLPQALSEFYAEVEGVQSVELDMQEINGIPHLYVVINHAEHDGLHHFLTLDDFSSDFHGGFRAAHTAEEMRRGTIDHIEQRPRTALPEERIDHV